MLTALCNVKCIVSQQLLLLLFLKEKGVQKRCVAQSTEQREREVKQKNVEKHFVYWLKEKTWTAWKSMKVVTDKNQSGDIHPENGFHPFHSIGSFTGNLRAETVSRLKIKTDWNCCCWWGKVYFFLTNEPSNHQARIWIADGDNTFSKKKSLQIGKLLASKHSNSYSQLKNGKIYLKRRRERTNTMFNWMVT